MAERPFNAAEPTFAELIEASSLATPGARVLRAQGHHLLSGEDSLTGVPEEQADWDGTALTPPTGEEDTTDDH
jgi:hypothetical protein